MTEEKSGLSRRTIVKGAAWSVPVVAAAVATPLAAASVTGASVSWGPNSGPLLALGLLNGAQSGGSLVNVNALPNGPRYFTINNPTAGAIQGPLHGTVTILYKSGLPVLSTKGYGVYAISGDPAAVTGRVETAQAAGLGGTYETTQNIIVAGNVPGGTSDIQVPVTFGLTQGGSLGLSVLVDFTVSLSLFDANNVQLGSTTATTMAIPVGLNIL